MFSTQTFSDGGYRSRLKVEWLQLLVCVSLSTGSLAKAVQTVSGSAYFPNQILVMPRSGGDRVALARFHEQQGVRVLQSFDGIRGLQTVRWPARETVPGMISRYERSGLVEFAEPDYL